MLLRNAVETQRTTRRHIPEDDTLPNHRCENLKSYMNENVCSSEVSVIRIMNTTTTPLKFGYVAS
jgi:hypothetical protein